MVEPFDETALNHRQDGSERGSSANVGIWHSKMEQDMIKLTYRYKWKGFKYMSIVSAIDLQSFFPKDLEIISVKETQKELWLYMRSRSKSYQCPRCGEKLHRLHATHHRKVQDLPVFGKRVMLDVVVHDFQCLNKDCNTGAIAETFDGFLNYYSRMTERLVDFVTILALETSCESSARIMQAMNVRISGDTVIRMLLKRYGRQPKIKCGNCIGVDDFAFKKRHTYGTVIVDEHTHVPVAILEGRDGAALKEWLKNNKHVTTVTRDRASAYAKAVEEILPDCMQIADRFHLHQNLLEAVKNTINASVPVDIKIPMDYKGTSGQVTSNGQGAITSMETNKKNSGHGGRPDGI